MPYKNDGTARRELYRTQCRFYDDEQLDGDEFASMQKDEFWVNACNMVLWFLLSHKLNYICLEKEARF